MVHSHWLFILAMTAVVRNMTDNEELKSSIDKLTKSVKSIQNELLTLKRGAIHSGSNLQLLPDTQQSSTDVVADDNSSPTKKARAGDEDPTTDDEELEDCEVIQTPSWCYQKQCQRSLKQPSELN